MDKGNADKGKEAALIIGRRIAEARRRNNMSQSELAGIMNISFQAVSRWERGESMPEIYRLRSLAEALHISLDELLSLEDP